MFEEDEEKKKKAERIEEEEEESAVYVRTYVHHVKYMWFVIDTLTES